jgi:two-component system OmpR family response regulator
VVSTAYASGVSLGLAAREFSVLYLLASRAGQLVAGDQLLARGWPEQPAECAATLKATIWRLRRKHADSKSTVVIRTVRGRGYLLETTTSDDRVQCAEQQTGSVGK